MAHSITVTQRSRIEITGVTEVIGFDAENIVLETDMGRLTVQGEALSVCDLCVEEGKIIATGNITAMGYAKSKKGKGGLISGLFG